MGHPSPQRRNTRAVSKLDLGVCGAGGPSQTQLEHASDAAPSPKRVTRASCRNMKGMPDQDVENKRSKKSIIMGGEVKQKSKGKEAMDKRHIIKKQPDKVQHTSFFSCIFLFTHLPFLNTCLCPYFYFFHCILLFFYTFFMFQDLRKKESARRLILINNTLEDPQKKAIERVGFGGLLLVQCWSVPEKLSS